MFIPKNKSFKNAGFKRPLSINKIYFKNHLNSFYQYIKKQSIFKNLGITAKFSYFW